jgi:hypothetical protein
MEPDAVKLLVVIIFAVNVEKLGENRFCSITDDTAVYELIS